MTMVFKCPKCGLDTPYEGAPAGPGLVECDNGRCDWSGWPHECGLVELPHPGAQVQALRDALNEQAREAKQLQLHANGLELQLKEALAQGAELAKRSVEQPDLAHAAMVLGKGIYLHGLLDAAQNTLKQCSNWADGLGKVAHEFLIQALNEEIEEKKP